MTTRCTRSKSGWLGNVSVQRRAVECGMWRRRGAWSAKRRRCAAHACTHAAAERVCVRHAYGRWRVCAVCVLRTQSVCCMQGGLLLWWSLRCFLPLSAAFTALSWSAPRAVRLVGFACAPLARALKHHASGPSGGAMQRQLKPGHRSPLARAQRTKSVPSLAAFQRVSSARAQKMRSIRKSAEPLQRCPGQPSTGQRRWETIAGSARSSAISNLSKPPKGADGDGHGGKLTNGSIMCSLWLTSAGSVRCLRQMFGTVISGRVACLRVCAVRKAVVRLRPTVRFRNVRFTRATGRCLNYDAHSAHEQRQS